MKLFTQISAHSRINSVFNTKVVAAFALFILSLGAFAGDKIDKTLDMVGDGEVEIHNNRGNIVLEGWDKDQVSVKGELDDLTEKFVFVSEGNKTLIKVVLPDRNYHSKSGRGSNLKIFVPMNVSVQFGGVATDLEISKINGGVDISSVSGSIQLSSIGKRAYINSISGNIKLKDVAGSLEVSTVSGDVDASVSANRIAINGVSSNITVRTENIELAKLSTVSGDTKLYGRLEKEGEVKLGNVSGDSYFYVKGDLNARVDLETGPGGDVINQYSDEKPTSSFIGSEKLKYTAGSGEGLIRMSTVSGEIGLKRVN